MKIPYQFTPSLVAARSKSEKDNAPNLVDLKLERRDGKGFLSATNGHIAIVVEVDDLEDEDVAGTLPAGVITAAEDGASVDENGVFFCPHITAGVGDVVVELEEQPGCRTMIAKRTDADLFPDVAGAIRSIQRENVVARVAINVKLLSRLSKAIGTDAVVLCLRDMDGKRGIEVIPHSNAPSAKKVSAILMPRRDDENASGDES